MTTNVRFRSGAKATSFGVVIILLALFIQVRSTYAGIPVYDPANWAVNFKQEWESTAHFGKELLHWQKQIQQIDRQIVQLQGFMSVSMPMNNKMERRQEDYNVQERCGGAAGLSTANLWRTVAPRSVGNIREQQKNICELIVRAENMKYNETVELLKILERREVEWRTLQQERNRTGESTADLDAHRANVEKFTTQMAKDLDYWNANMNAYSQLITTLEGDQKVLAQRALKGQESPLGTLVKTVTLKAALQVNK